MAQTQQLSPAKRNKEKTATSLRPLGNRVLLRRLAAEEN